MIKMIGSLLCPDCIECKQILEDRHIEYEFIDINASMMNLKLFLSYRDTSPVFDKVKERGNVGIPLLIIGGELIVNYRKYFGFPKEKTSCGIHGC